MASRKGTSSESTAPGNAFQDAERAARALRRAVMMLNDVHGEGAGAGLLAPLLQELAQVAHRRGLDVAALVQHAIEAPAEPSSEPEGMAGGGRRRLNSRLFHALTKACIEMLELSRSEMEPGAMSHELYRMMLGAGVYEDLSASPRDPEKHLTAALPRDAVLSLMYLLASRRQHAEEFYQNGHTELREHHDEELVRAGERLRELGCNADIDPAMGIGIALWTPDEQQVADGVRGLCFTFGRSATDSRGADFIVRFDPENRLAAQRAADTLYRAHLAQRRRRKEELIDLHGIMFEPHPLHRGELAEAFAASPIDPALLRNVAPRFATLTYFERATAHLQRCRFIPVGECEPAEQGRRTRH